MLCRNVQDQQEMLNMSYDLKQPVIHSQGIVNATHTSLCVFNVCLIVVSIAQV